MPLKKHRILLSFAFFCIILGFMQFTVQHIIGFDGYLNIKAAELIRERGFSGAPAPAFTILNENRADIQFLFRAMLIPFTFLGLELGMKIAAVIFGAVCFSAFYWFLLENKIKYAFFYALVYLFCAESLMQRFMQGRQMPLAISIMLLSIYFIQRKKYTYLAIACAAFTMLYSGFVMVILLIILYFITEALLRKRLDYKPAIYTTLGIAGGIAVNPYFPSNIAMLYTQIFKVNLAANLYNQEWRAWGFSEFIANNWLAIAILALSISCIALKKKAGHDQFFLLLSCLSFLILTVKSRRMQEYYIPFCILLAAFSLNDIVLRAGEKKHFMHAKYATLAVLVIIAGFNTSLLRNDIRNNDFLYHFDNCSEWMKKNIPANSLIFVNAYAYNYLFFMDSSPSYTHGIDLTYSYLYDNVKFERYMGIFRGTLKSSQDYILSDYHPDFVFSGKVEQDMNLYKYIISHKEGYKAAYEDDWCAVIKVK